MPLLLIGEDALEGAVRIAAAVSRPDAGRTALLAQAAQRLADAGAHADRVLAALHAVLPATSVALTDPVGGLLTGRRAVLDAADAVRVEVPGPDGRPLAVLVADSRSRTVGWATTVAAVLRLAVAQLTAWSATRRLAEEQLGRSSELLLHRLTGAASSDEEADARTRTEAAALGWALSGPLIAFALRPAAEAGTASEPGPALRALWARHGIGGPLVASEDCWVSWRSAAADKPDAGPEVWLRTAEAQLTSAVSAMAAYLPVAGEWQARRTAPTRSARHSPMPGPPRRSPPYPAPWSAPTAWGRPSCSPRSPPTRYGGPPRSCSGRCCTRTGTAPSCARWPWSWIRSRPSAAAEVLGVHRNTVAARMERVRALGFDPEDPAQRLSLHLACRVLLAES
ncbi:helix-turn-helix domain-containing protein [Kitasatospora aburaviensis]